MASFFDKPKSPIFTDNAYKRMGGVALEKTSESALELAPELETNYVTPVWTTENTLCVTTGGVMFKTAIMLFIMLFSGTIAAIFIPPVLLPLAAIGSAIIGFILSLVVIFKPTSAPKLAPVYALFEGVFLVALSLFLSHRYPGIPVQALLATGVVFVVMLICYQTRIIKCSETFISVMKSAGIAILLFFVVNIFMMILGYGEHSVLNFDNNGAISILVSVILVAFAALFLILDFHYIEQAAEAKLPKRNEWYLAFGLCLTIVWLYVELLRLLAKLYRR